jgi:hypothetical protein
MTSNRHQLAIALEPLTRALRSLQECARAHRAFVIVEDTVTGRFSGSSEDPLWFDAPQLGVVNTGPKFEDAEEAAEYALRALLENHRLPEFAILSIVFESTGKDGRS